MCRPEQEPGEAFCYSNLGYTTAGVLAEAVTGVAWEDLMRREVFSPLGLATAGFGAPGRDQGSNAGPAQDDLVQDDLAQPWGHQAGWWSFTALRPDDAQADNPPLIGPAGTVHLSLPDLARYVAFHVSGGATAPGYLRPETVKVMHTPRRHEKEAFGWFLSPPDENGIGKRMLWHDGSNNAWYAAMLMVPEDRRGLAFVCNAYRDSLADPEGGAMEALAEIYIG